MNPKSVLEIEINFPLESEPIIWYIVERKYISIKREERRTKQRKKNSYNNNNNITESEKNIFIYRRETVDKKENYENFNRFKLRFTV